MLTNFQRGMEGRKKGVSGVWRGEKEERQVEREGGRETSM